MAEAAVVRAIQRELDHRHAWHCNLHGDGTGRNGLPDEFVVYRGRPILIEYKAPRGRVAALQAWELGQARRSGAITIVARRLTDVTDVLDEIDEQDRCVVA
jgi:hypothetical protein